VTTDRAPATGPLPSGRLVVAVDGPSSSGKSTVGAEAARRLDYRFCDTGLLYRAVTWLATERGISPADTRALVSLAGEVRLIADEHGHLGKVQAAGREVTKKVRGAAVDRAVSDYSKVPELRSALVPRQREIAADGRIIVAGRDIGTVIFPDADVKIYLQASAEERARRRVEQRGLDPDGPEAHKILEELRRRDRIDSGRKTAPLRSATDAVVLSTDGNTFEQTVEAVVETVRQAERRAENAASEGLSTARPVSAGKGLAFFPRFTATVLRLILACLTRVKAEGLDRIPRTGPLLIVCNHCSNADGALLMTFVVPALGRPMGWIGKEEALRWPVVGWAIRQNGVFGVRRGAGDLEAFKTAKSVLDEGRVLTIFPEGTRSPTGALQSAKEGATVLAIRSGAPVLAIALVGSHRFLPKGKLLPRPGRRMEVRVGEPFTLTMPAGADRHESLRLATTELMRHLAELLPPEQRGVYAEAVQGAGTGGQGSGRSG
jgi:cytidylate kinase